MLRDHGDRVRVEVRLGTLTLFAMCAACAKPVTALVPRARFDGIASFTIITCLTCNGLCPGAPLPCPDGAAFPREVLA